MRTIIAAIIAAASLTASGAPFLASDLRLTGDANGNGRSITNLLSIVLSNGQTVATSADVLAISNAVVLANGTNATQATRISALASGMTVSSGVFRATVNASSLGLTNLQYLGMSTNYPGGTDTNTLYATSDVATTPTDVRGEYVWNGADAYTNSADAGIKLWPGFWWIEAGPDGWASIETLAEGTYIPYSGSAAGNVDVLYGTGTVSHATLIGQASLSNALAKVAGLGTLSKSNSVLLANVADAGTAAGRNIGSASGDVLPMQPGAELYGIMGATFSAESGMEIISAGVAKAFLAIAATNVSGLGSLATMGYAPTAAVATGALTLASGASLTNVTLRGASTTNTGHLVVNSDLTVNGTISQGATPLGTLAFSNSITASDIAGGMPYVANNYGTASNLLMAGALSIRSNGYDVARLLLNVHDQSWMYDTNTVQLFVRSRQGGFNTATADGYSIVAEDNTYGRHVMLSMGAHDGLQSSYIQSSGVGGGLPLVLQERGGRVSIGADAPAAKLHVGGDMAGIVVENRTNTPATYTSGGQIFALTNELFAMDGAGNVTQLSTHEGLAHVAKSYNVWTGTGRSIDLDALAAAVQSLTGQTNIVRTITVPARDWDAEEAKIVAKVDAERAQKQAAKDAYDAMDAKGKATNAPPAAIPDKYKAQPKPKWLTDALKAKP